MCTFLEQSFIKLGISLKKSTKNDISNNKQFEQIFQQKQRDNNIYSII